MRVVLKTIANVSARRVFIAESTFDHGAWISAVEQALNDAKGYDKDERRFLITDQYLGGGPMPPFGIHRVQFARYDPAANAYRVDEPLNVEVSRK